MAKATVIKEGWGFGGYDRAIIASAFVAFHSERILSITSCCVSRPRAPPQRIASFATSADACRDTVTLGTRPPPIVEESGGLTVHTNQAVVAAFRAPHGAKGPFASPP